jgi:hypothetical protein
MSELRNSITPEPEDKKILNPVSDETTGVSFEDSPYIEQERGGPKEVRTDTFKRVVRGIIGLLALTLIVELVAIYQLGFRLPPREPQIPTNLLIQQVEPTTVWVVEPPQPTETPYPVIEETLPTEPPPLHEFVEPPTLEPGVLITE